MGKAAIEFLSAGLRYWLKDDYGAPYQWCATVRWIDRFTVELILVMEPPTPDAWREVRHELAGLGVKEIKFCRIVDGVEEMHSLKTKRKRAS